MVDLPYAMTAKHIFISLAAYMLMQVSKNVSIATFEVKMDSLMAMSINHTDLSYVVNNNVQPESYISMIAFRYCASILACLDFSSHVSSSYHSA